METLLYGRMMWMLGQEHHAKLRTVQTIGFCRRQRFGDNLLFPKTLKKIRCKNVKTVIRERKLLFVGAVARQHNERLPGRVVFWALNRIQAGEPGARQGHRRVGYMPIGQSPRVPSYPRPY